MSEKQQTPQQLVGLALCRGEYTLRQVIGRGGMGSVYLVSHRALNVPLAMKRIRADKPLPESVERELDARLAMQPATQQDKLAIGDFPSSGGEHTDRFLREALFLARLHHRAIPALYDYFCEDGYWHLVMDYVPGQTLSHYLRKHAPLPPLEALNYAMQLCDVLHYLHSQRPPIIFRDLKPSNLILTKDNTLVLIDFGIARYFKEGQINDTTDFGSPGYASPEQYQTEGQTDERSDLYSLGIILHEMLTGQRPTVLNSVRTTLESVRTLAPAVSPTLSGLVALATRHEPEYRFQSARTFYLALERATIVEEQRAYERLLEPVGAGADTNVHTESALEAAMQETVPFNTDARVGTQREEVFEEPLPALSVLTLEQRQQVRAVLQEERQLRLRQEQLEQELASVDEGLRRRASSSFAPVPRSFEQELSPLPEFVPKTRSLYGILRTGFILLLLLVVVCSSVFVYTRYLHPQTPQVLYTTPTTPPAAAVQSAWKALPSLPGPEADNAVVYTQVQGRSYVYMNGGYRGAKLSPHYDHTLYRYDIVATHWEQQVGQKFPGMVNNAGVQAGQGQLFFTAGYSTDSYTVPSLLYAYQPANGTLQKIVPPASVAIGFGGALLADQQGHLYLTQGFMRAGDAHAQAGTGWYRYDITSGRWQTLAPLPQGLGYVVLAQDNSGGIILLGGARDAGQQMQSSTIYRYDIASNQWRALGSAPYAISGAASCVVAPGQLVIVGGFDAVHQTARNQVWLLDLHTLRWQPLKSLPAGGSVLGAATSDGEGHVYLVRGARDTSTPTADFWELTVIFL